MQNRIRELRQERELTLDQLGKRVGLTAAQIARLEKGERPLSLHWMEQIAAALSITPAALLPDYPAGAGEIVEDPLERKLLREFRRLTPSQLDTLQSLFRSWAQEMHVGDKSRRRTA